MFPTEGVAATVVVEADDVRSGATAAGITALRDRGRRAQMRSSPGPRSSTARTAPSPRSTSRPPAAATTPRPCTPWTSCATRSSPRPSARSRGTSVNVSGDAASSEDFASQLNEQAAADLRLRVRTRVPAHARHVPLDRDPDQGDHPQPALGRGRLRRARARLPGRPRRVAARVHLDRRRGELAAAVPVRRPVRALDGLPRLHPLPGPRAL